MKKSLFVVDGHISANVCDGAIEVTYSGSRPDYVIRIDGPNGPLYFADATEAAQSIKFSGTENVTLIPVNN